MFQLRKASFNAYVIYIYDYDMKHILRTYILHGSDVIASVHFHSIFVSHF